ncbi:guanylate kinase [Clostridium algidicarnis]|uniref:Guanylate kinase n=2 Tax=Clostridium algidicarnis TaxID=37659 RepID=A0A2S6FY43_9CLOT|nr:guanylate kinase [Clostridium algidicarnis]MBB6632373.1 guanylate kinase [Clostridium algidicarnis]MBB6698637.1 guanylate kinase [Clostridium algidicarnis]MBU3192620.1 guanylate kinase [Clostridium algidicarnis]MBU3204197.1 guanylate kinase [Clostridium algidicarnis]MBU3207115.1 guanylate kinase [Clostridium algidicarnis]
MGKIFCLMGKSSSGKDTIFKKLKEDDDLKLKPIITYTTRPKRVSETNGVEYYFINEDILESYKIKGKVIEQRMYNTVNGDWCYATLDDGQIDLNKDDYILIVTLEAYKDLKAYFGENHVFPLYVMLDDGIRLERALKREREQKDPNYDEICRRFLADNIDFSIDKLEECGVNKYYRNDDLKECICKIKYDILNVKIHTNKLL